MSQRFRLAEGGRIDRTRPLAFRFDGTTLNGYAGDTLASALLANGIHLVGRSYKYHRPQSSVKSMRPTRSYPIPKNARNMTGSGRTGSSSNKVAAGRRILTGANGSLTRELATVTGP